MEVTKHFNGDITIYTYTLTDTVHHVDIEPKRLTSLILIDAPDVVYSSQSLIINSLLWSTRKLGSVQQSVQPRG